MRDLGNGCVEVFLDDPDDDDAIFGGPWHEMTDEECRKYSRQVTESEGFDVELIPNVMAFGIIQPGEIDDDARGLAKLGVAHYNKENQGASLELVDVVKFMGQVCSPFTFYITFTGKETSNNQVGTYQTKVVTRCPADKTYVEFTRVKPGTETQETKGRKEREEEDEEKQGKRLKSSVEGIILK